MTELSSFDGTTLYFEEEGTGPPVVLLHGLSASIQLNWRAPGVWAALVSAGHRVIGLDARAHGRSHKPHDPAAYRDGAMEKDVLALLDVLNLPTTDLVGYSMGAATALRFATEHGSRLNRLVLGGIGGDPTKWGKPPQDGKATLQQRWAAGLDAEDPEAIEDPAGRGARKLFEARGNDLRAMSALLRSGRRHLSADLDLSAVKVPTLVVCGDKDASPSALAQALPDGHAVVLEGDHESVVRNPQLAESIVDFLEP
jgi:pimeloyl-ACP methyl ester carboxylesterase